MDILNRDSIIFDTDSYKLSHNLQYPPGTQSIYSTIYARKSSIPEIENVVFFGLQAYIQKYLSRPITDRDIDDAAMLANQHGLPFNEKGWNEVLVHHRGRLPLHIQALPEGTVVRADGKVPMVSITSEPGFAWLVSHVETGILRAVWYPSTVATISKAVKDLIRSMMSDTSDNIEEGINFKLHDFGARGASSRETAMIGGAAHLLNFRGTDTVDSMPWLSQYYGADTVAGFSIPASEHSTMTSWGQVDELGAYRNMVEEFAQNGKMFACVIDSYDTMAAVELWAKDEALLPEVKRKGATVVLRPDSGNPVEEPIKVIERLMELVGYETNSKGWKVLPRHVRVIQGDGVNFNSIKQILATMRLKGLSIDNIAFGMGGALLQKVDRDTFGFCMKASAMQYYIGGGENEWRPIKKNPVGDSTKSSHFGIVYPGMVDGKIEAISGEDCGIVDSLFHEVYTRGRHVPSANYQTLDEIRKRVDAATVVRKTYQMWTPWQANAGFERPQKIKHDAKEISWKGGRPTETA